MEFEIGSIIQYAGSTAPSGWLICDGSELNRESYSDLFEVIGTYYGVGNGTTTFNIPDLRGKVAVGLKSNETEFNTLGRTGGEKTHTLTIQEIPSHSHDIGWAQTTNLTDPGQQGIPGQAPNNRVDSWKTFSTGGGQPHNIMQPYIVLNYIIKVLDAPATGIRSETLPVGTVIDYEGNTIPVGWEEIEETVLKKELTADVMGNASVNWQNLGDLYLDLTPGTWFVKANTFITSNGNGIGYNKSCLSFNSTGGAVYDRLDSMASSYPNEPGATHSSVHSLSCIVSVKETTRIYLLEAFAYTGSNGTMTLMCDKYITSGGPSIIRATKLN
jgi:microcystin-dependent protein